MTAAPTESCSRLSTSPVITSPVSRDGELEHLAGDGAAQSVDQRDAVLHFEHGADVVDVHRTEVSGLDFLEQDFLQFAGTQHRIRGHGAQSLRVRSQGPKQLVKIITSPGFGQAWNRRERIAEREGLPWRVR